MTEDGHLPEVYVDGQTLVNALNQSGIPLAELQSKMPQLSEQLQEALHTNGDVKIDTADYATNIAGTPLDAAILPHLKTDPEGMTYAQGQEHLANQQTEMTQQAQDVATKQAEQSERDKQLAAINADTRQQFDATGRFPSEVTSKYAELRTRFIDTQAQAMGVSPDEVNQMMPLKVTGESLGGAAFDQARPNDGPFGPIADQFKGDAAGAIEHLTREKTGEAVGALSHAEIGDIDLVWGKEGTGKSNGYGLAKIAKFHPEVLGELQDILSGMHVTSKTDNRVQLESADHKAAVQLNWHGTAKKWLLTAFEKGGDASTRADTAGLKGEGDTARFTAADSNIAQDLDKFYQSANKNRGSYNPQTGELGLLKDADLSTALHELGHHFLESMNTLAEHPNAPQGIKDDFDTLLQHFNVKGETPEERQADWSGRTLEDKRAGHEQFAEGFEKYLFDGKEPLNCNMRGDISFGVIHYCPKARAYLVFLENRLHKRRSPILLHSLRACDRALLRRIVFKVAP